MKKLTTFFLLLLSTSVIGQTVYNISDPGDIQDVVYGPGDVIILEDGNYDDSNAKKFIGYGTSEKPIIFRPETPGGVVFTNGFRLKLGGEYLIVEDFHWKGGVGVNNHIDFRSNPELASHSIIRNCVMDGLEPEPDDPETLDKNESDKKHRWIVLHGQYNSVENCSFLNKRSPGALILVDLKYYEESGHTTTGHQIKNNFFYNFEKIDTDAFKYAGDSETIRVGASSYQAFNTEVLVEGNYFYKSDGENEIITNKSANNTYKNNTFRACRGSLVLRHGAGATVEGNYFLGENIDGTGGVRISDSNHIITNNYFQDLVAVDSGAIWNNGITFIGGDVASGGEDSGYQIVENIFVAHNSFYNVNAPLYFNNSKGDTDPTGTFANNLFYTTLTDIITGDFANLGAGLVYENNIYEGANLGATLTASEFNTGVIDFTANGEIFSPSDVGAAANTAVDTNPIVTNDITGLTRPGTSNDVGANEVSGATGTAAFNPFTTNDIGDSVGSSFTDVTTLSVSLSNNDLADSIKLFPNPVIHGTLYLSKASTNLDKLTIYDVSGKVVLSKRLNSALNKEEVNVSSISQGLYFVEITSGSSRVVNKIVISK